MKTWFTVETDPEPITIETTRSALLVIDMQNAFFKAGGYLDFVGHDLTENAGLIQPCKEIIHKARAAGVKVVYIQMIYRPEPSESDSPYFQKSRAMRLLKEYPELKNKFYLEGSWGAEIVEDLRPVPGDIIVRKQKYDAFIGTDLDGILKKHGVRYLVFIGTATNICVESTIRHAFFLDYFPILVSDAVTPLGPKITQEATVSNMISNFGWVTDSRRLLEAFPDSR